MIPFFQLTWLSWKNFEIMKHTGLQIGFLKAALNEKKKWSYFGKQATVENDKYLLRVYVKKKIIKRAYK